MPSPNAHAARVDDNNMVEEVIVIPYCNDNDADVTAYCNAIGLPGRWLDTSYIGARRARYAGSGMTYDPALDVFLYPRPYPSWSLDDTFTWQAPVPCPGLLEDYVWNEAEQRWVNIT